MHSFSKYKYVYLRTKSLNKVIIVVFTACSIVLCLCIPLFARHRTEICLDQRYSKVCIDQKNLETIQGWE